MNENLNLVEILKDCPEGTEFYSSIYGNVKFKRINKEDIKHPIEFYTLNDYHDVTADGRHLYMFDGECTFFPSKDQRDWSKWQRPFVDGDIVFYNDTVAIFKEWGDETLFRTYVAKGLNCEDLIGINTPLFGKSVRNEIRFATEEEKQILFKALEENGYKWNAETKTLEKIKKEKFDPKTLQPFDKVLVRQYDECWHIQFFETMYEYDKNHPFRCLGGKLYSFCIPYADNEYLLDTTDEPSEFYKY